MMYITSVQNLQRNDKIDKFWSFEHMHPHYTQTQTCVICSIEYIVFRVEILYTCRIHH